MSDSPIEATQSFGKLHLTHSLPSIYTITLQAIGCCPVWAEHMSHLVPLDMRSFGRPRVAYTVEGKRKRAIRKKELVCWDEGLIALVNDHEKELRLAVDWTLWHLRDCA